MRFERRGFGGRRNFGDRSFGRSNDIPKPVKVGEEYDIEISEVGSRGDGIARIKNFVVFVNGAKQGEKAKVKITEVRDRFAIGEKVGAASESAESESAPAESAEATEEPAAESKESEEVELKPAEEESEEEEA